MDSDSLHIKNILGIDSSLAEEIKAICKPVKYPANKVIHHTGEFNTKALFLLKGVSKYSIFGQKDTEIILQFNRPYSFFPYSYHSFYLNKDAVTDFATVTEMEGLELTSEKLIPILDKNPTLYVSFIKTMLKHHQEIQSKEINIIQKTNGQRYTEFVDLYKDVIADIPLKDLAAYLHIQPGSLSRIRKKLNS